MVQHRGRVPGPERLGETSAEGQSPRLDPEEQPQPRAEAGLQAHPLRFHLFAAEQEGEVQDQLYSVLLQQALDVKVLFHDLVDEPRLIHFQVVARHLEED